MSPATTETVSWSIQDHIGSPERQIGYLEAAFEDGDPGLIAAAIGDIARARGASGTALLSGPSQETLYEGFIAGGNPTLASVVAVLKSLDLRLNVEPASTSS